MADNKVLGPPGCNGGGDDDGGDDGDDGDDGGKRGKRGHRGHSGPTGPTGPTGSSGTAVNLLKFSGLATVDAEAIIETTYLADTGVFFGSLPLTFPLNYPVPSPFEVGSFATNVLTDLSIPPGGSILFEIVKNDATLPVVVATITYDSTGTGAGGIKTTTFAPVTFEVGDTIDVRVITTPGLVVGGTINVSAMVGP